MVSMQNEDTVDGAREHIVDLVFLTRNRKHHAHEVGRIGQIVARINVGFAHRILVSHGDKTGHLADELHGSHGSLLGIEQVAALGIERGHGSDQAGQNRHRMCIAAEPLQEEMHRLVNERVVHHEVLEVFLFFCVGQFAFEKQITDFKVVAVAGELLDRIAAIEQFARRAVNVRNSALAGGRAHEARVVCELSRLLVERRNVDDFRTDGAGQNRQANFRRTVGKHEFY